MTIEEEIFHRKNISDQKLTDYGFQKNGACFQYAADFMNHDFQAVLTVNEKKVLSGIVIDHMNDEEYAPLRNPHMTGTFVSTVRDEYRKLLEEISDQCCDPILFSSEQANRITGRILESYQVQPDFPWEQSQFQNYGAFRHAGNQKWFALIMNVNKSVLLKEKPEGKIDIINLKINPDEGAALREKEGIFPAYHMNHKNWISVTLDDVLSDEEIMELLHCSYVLTA